MLAESSNDTCIEVRDAPLTDGVAWPGRLLMLALNVIPLLHAAAVIFAILRGGFISALGILYLMPPLIARIIFITADFKHPRIKIGSAVFFQWWALFQLQVIFCRLPALEEILRLVPGLYSFWLRLWGSRVGRLTYWAPGTFISDRSFLTIGNNVVLGAGVRLIPHLIQRTETGSLELALANIQIGDRVVVGGFSILSAGTTVHADQTTRAALLSSPFTQWRNGKRIHHE